MSNYTFTFKKDDIFVEFVTTDKQVVERQFQIWVADADDYAQKHQQALAKKKAIQPHLKLQPEIKEEETPKVETSEPIKPQPQVEPPKTSVGKTIVEEKSQETKPEVFDKASDLLKTINTIQNPPTEEEKSSKTTDFEEILEKTIESTPETVTFETPRAKDPIFLNLINSKNTTDKFHYLMITAYYLLEFEKLERFSLKQINAKLMQNLSEVIDHTTLQEAIDQEFIELVPDLTGISEVAEYRITPAGEDFFANKI